MKREPLIKIVDGVHVKHVHFADGKRVHISNDHTEGYWLIFRKTIYNLEKEFKFVIEFSNGKKIEVTIKEGFKFDLASTPKAIWWLYPPMDDRYAAPATGHDGLYGAEIFDRAINDEVLYIGMKECKATKFDIFSFKEAVGTWGWTAYLKHNKSNIEKNRTFVAVKELP
ncbi:MAG TPA: DUF1353 domain-containing protein [Candidatus Cloacimonadota bacterium]|nr:DUF1353 domain-containing protein [Candidatus Cloacimonadota bacterium]